MVATVQIYEAVGGSDGSPGTKTRVDGQAGNAGTDIRFSSSDAVNPVAGNPNVIPASGDNYSYWKHLYLNISGTFTTISNIRFYTDGTISWACGTGGGLFVCLRDAGDHGAPMDTEYDIATGTVGTTGHWCDDGTNGHGYYKDQTAIPVLASGYTQGSNLLIDSTSYSSADESDATVLQLKIHDDASAGTLTDETLYWRYDET